MERCITFSKRSVHSKIGFTYQLLKLKLLQQLKEICVINLKNMIENFGSVEKMTNYFSLFSKRFGITTDIIDNAKCGVDLNISPLFLGVEKKLFYNRSSRMS